MRKTLLHNGKVYIGKENEFCDYFVIQDKEIIKVGNGKYHGDVECTVDLNGKIVLPGCMDGHVHIYLMGEVANYVDLHDCTSMEEMLNRIRKHSELNLDKKWIVGFGWEQDVLDRTGKYPTASDIDKAISDRPVLLWRACWHILVANSKALELAGICEKVGSDWNQIYGQTGNVDMEHGRVTGIFREQATGLIHKHVSETSKDIRKSYLKYGLQQCLNAGITAVQTNDHDCWQLYEELQKNGELPIRVFLTPDYDEIGNDGKIPPPTYENGLIACDRVKIFGDGSLGAETAALRTPYVDTENRGVLIQTDEMITQKIQRAIAHGYRLEIHAIGDRAAKQIVNAFQVPNTLIDRPIMTHCQVLGQDILDDMAALNIIGNIQPSFVPTDTEFARKRLHASVQPYAYCWKSMLEAGIALSGGSDAPIESCNPFQGMHDAIYRQRKASVPVYSPNEKLSIRQAIQLYTTGAAYAAHREHILGKIAKGYLADFVVLEEGASFEEMDEIRPAQVWVDGTLRLENPSKALESTIVEGNYMPGKNGKIRVCRCCQHYTKT